MSLFEDYNVNMAFLSGVFMTISVIFPFMALAAFGLGIKDRKISPQTREEIIKNIEQQLKLVK